MNNIVNLEKEGSVSESDAIRMVINRTLIVEWGTIKEVVGDGSVVNVLLSVTDKPENTAIVTCVLISPCSNSFSVKLMPKEGDKVLVLSPRFYDSDMFKVSDDTEVIVNEEQYGYNKLSCLAILFNQFNSNNHKNYIEINDGEIKVTNTKATVNVDKDGNISIEADGKYTIKNKDTDLQKVIDGLAKEVEGLVTEGNQYTQSTSATSKAKIATWRTATLNKLFDSGSTAP